MTLETTIKRGRYLAAVPVKYRGIAERALAGTGNKGNAIRAKCLDCTGYVRADVEHCQVVLCPLYEFRPRYGGTTQEQQDEQTMPVPDRH